MTTHNIRLHNVAETVSVENNFGRELDATETNVTFDIKCATAPIGRILGGIENSGGFYSDYFAAYHKFPGAGVAIPDGIGFTHTNMIARYVKEHPEMQDMPTRDLVDQYFKELYESGRIGNNTGLIGNNTVGEKVHLPIETISVDLYGLLPNSGNALPEDQKVTFTHHFNSVDWGTNIYFSRNSVEGIRAVSGGVRFDHLMTLDDCNLVGAFAFSLASDLNLIPDITRKIREKGNSLLVYTPHFFIPKGDSHKTDMFGAVIVYEWDRTNHVLTCIASQCSSYEDHSIAPTTTSYGSDRSSRRMKGKPEFLRLPGTDYFVWTPLSVTEEQLFWNLIFPTIDESGMPRSIELTIKKLARGEERIMSKFSK